MSIGEQIALAWESLMRAIGLMRRPALWAPWLVLGFNGVNCSNRVGINKEWIPENWSKTEDHINQPGRHDQKRHLPKTSEVLREENLDASPCSSEIGKGY